MKISYLKLVNFKRFPLRDLEVFEHEFNSKLLMVSGPNGAGKSSLFDQLTPLPPDKSDFDTGGYKEIRLEKDSHIYTLTADFTGSPKFSFLVDGEELNAAGIVTTQRELVAQHFKITQGIHDIMIGKENFTNMSLPARKKLFSAITHLNIDKVLEGYNKLKDQQKNNTLLLKSLTASYQLEEQKLMDKDRVDSLKADLDTLKTHMDALLNMRSEIQRFNQGDGSDEPYNALLSATLRMRVEFGNNRILHTSYPAEDLVRLKTENTSALTLITHKLNEVYRTLETRHSELRNVERTGAVNRQSLVEEKARLTTNIEKLINGLKMFKDIESVNEGTIMALYKLEASLPDILRNLQTNIGLDGEKQFTTERYNGLLEEKKRILDKLQELNAMELSIKNSLKAADGTQGTIACPSCQHTWPIKDAIKASIHAKGELADIERDLLLTRSRLAQNERSLEETIDYFTYYKQYSILRKETFEILEPFWTAAAKNDLIFSDPTAILSVMNIAGLELSNIGEIKHAQQELGIIERKLEAISTTESINIETVRQSIFDLEAEANELQETKRDLQEQARNIEVAAESYKRLESVVSDIQQAKLDVKNNNMNHLVTEICSVIDDEIRNTRINAISIENQLHQLNSVQYTLDKYQKEIEDTKENIKVLDLAIEELCPKNGLIAKSVSSFLNIIINSVNLVISKIWEYRMILKPIDVDNDSLNYRFKVEVEDKLTIADISSCSSGMQEIINLAFKMTIYRLLGLEGYPIFLDEFGSKLDVIHRSKVFSIIFGMINDPYYSQIFMITHIDSSIANFKEVETLEI